MNKKSVVREVYDGLAAGDIDRATAAMSDDIVWNEAESSPYADQNPYKGPQAVVEGVFGRLGSEWDGFAVKPAEMVAEGERVIVLGRYGATCKATGRPLDVPFVHAWTVSGGKVTSFQQYTDTAAFAAARGA